VDDLQQFEEEEQVGRAEQQGAGDLLSDAEGKVASEAAMAIVDLSVWGTCTATPQFTRVAWALLRTLKQIKTRLRWLGSYHTS
jgi:hypothetical protein